MTLEQSIEAALQAPMTASHRATLDARVARSIASRGPMAPRRRILRARRLLLAVAVVALGVPAFAGARIITTEDPFGSASAREFAAEIDAAKAAVPLPAGRSWPTGPSLAVDPDANYSRGGGRSTVEGVAVCIWLGEWLDARASGDAGREAKAAATIAAVPTWPSWTSPFWTIDLTAHLQPLIDAVAAGDDTPVRAEMASNCYFIE